MRPNRFHFIFTLFLTLFLIQSAFSEEYYGDFKLDLNREGGLFVSGSSNIDESYLNNYFYDFTSKEGKIWTLNYTLPQKFDTFLFQLQLPQGATLRYVKTTPDVRITETDSRLTIIGSGEGRELTLFVQYEIDSTSTTFDFNKVVVMVMSLLILVLSSAILFFKNKKNNIENNEEKKSKKNSLTKEEKKSKKNSLTKEENKSSMILETKKKSISETEKYLEEHFKQLPQRQQDIITLLKKNGTMTQKELDILMKIPKSSLSRNLKTLEVKNIITSEKIAQTKYIKLNEK